MVALVLECVVFRVVAGDFAAELTVGPANEKEKYFFCVRSVAALGT